MPRAWALFGAGSALVAGAGAGALPELVGRLAAPPVLALLFRASPQKAIGAALTGVLLLFLVLRGAPQEGQNALVLRTALPLAVSGLVVASGLARRHRASRVVFLAAVPFFLATLAFFFLPEVKEARAREAERAVESALAFYGGKEGGGAGAPAMEAMAREAAEIAVLLAPAMELLVLVTASAMAYALSVGLLRRFGAAARPISGFWTWRSPFPLVWVFAAGLAGVLFAGGPLREIGANLLFFASVLYLVQGSAVLFGQFRRKRVPAAFQVLFLAVAVLFAMPVFALLTVGAGLFDTWFDFRRLDRPAPEAGA